MGVAQLLQVAGLTFSKLVLSSVAWILFFAFPSDVLSLLTAEALFSLRRCLFLFSHGYVPSASSVLRTYVSSSSPLLGWHPLLGLPLSDLFFCVTYTETSYFVDMTSFFKFCFLLFVIKPSSHEASAGVFFE